jgi:hypothetical protein
MIDEKRLLIVEVGNDQVQLGIGVLGYSTQLTKRSITYTKGGQEWIGEIS